MSIQTEQEFKTMLTAKQALAIQAAYPFAAAFWQTNHYYDTAQGALRALHMGLRIRLLADRGEQTLKVPTGPKRLLTEYTEPVFDNHLQGAGVVQAKLADAGIAWPQLREFAQATTTRRICQLAAGLLTLDHTTYPNGCSDWELELEYHDPVQAAALWQQLLAGYAIIASPVRNKVARAASNVKRSQS